MDEAGTQSDQSKIHRFFSLKWKALLSTSLVLLVITVVISARSYISLHTQFSRSHQESYEHYVRDVQTMLQQSLDRLRQLGGLIPSLPAMQRALSSGDRDSLKQVIELQSPALQLDWGIDVLGFYDTSNHLLASWEGGGGKNLDTPSVLDKIKQVNEQEKPVTALVCDPECFEYAAVPVLAGGRNAGVVLVGGPIADLVLTLNQVSGNDIGLLVRGDRLSNNDEHCRRIPQWNTCVVALTHTEQNIEVLGNAAVATPLQQSHQGIRSYLAGRSYEIRLIPLPEPAGAESAFLVVIADITVTLNEIRHATQQIVLVGVAGWLVAEVLLLAVLWMPMSRLRRMASHLPLLAQSRFQDVRAAIAGRSQSHLFPDEIDVLDDTAIALADRLEELEYKVEARTWALSQRMEDLARERNFIANLLDTAQVMIVTQDRRGRIVMVNPFVESVTGLQKTELVGHDFKELLLSEEWAETSQRAKKELVSGKREHLRHESLVTCKDGSIRNVTWYHSRLTIHAADDPVILSVGMDITERVGAESRLAWLDDHDALTGLVNRHRFQEELRLLIKAAQRRKKTGALLCIDLDQFKYVNDTDGHHVGDALLKLVADALCSKAVAADVVARLGSDEFAVLVRETDADGAARVAAAVNSVFNEVNFAVGGQLFKISASIGIVLFPIHGDTVADLLASADLAMNQAKESGQGNWRLFSERDKVLERMHDRVYWKNRVTHALATDGLVLYYQPIMETASGNISHYEVLLRVQEEDGSLTSPSHFIDAAERGGLIHVVDRLVIEKALHFLAILHRRDRHVALSINLSGHSFKDPHLLDHLRRMLELHQVDAAKVIFEITETAAVADFAVAKGLILAIKELGCRFALDDFGIGFSSFYYLKYLPVDYLKIDGSFIRQLPDSVEDQIIVQAMSQVAGGFGKKTIAEFVETAATLDLLREYRIDYAQGYFIGKPQSAEETFRLRGADSESARPVNF